MKQFGLTYPLKVLGTLRVPEPTLRNTAYRAFILSYKEKA